MVASHGSEMILTSSWSQLILCQHLAVLQIIEMCVADQVFLTLFCRSVVKLAKGSKRLSVEWKLYLENKDNNNNDILYTIC